MSVHSAQHVSCSMELVLARSRSHGNEMYDNFLCDSLSFISNKHESSMCFIAICYSVYLLIRSYIISKYVDFDTLDESLSLNKSAALAQSRETRTQRELMQCKHIRMRPAVYCMVHTGALGL